MTLNITTTQILRDKIFGMNRRARIALITVVQPCFLYSSALYLFSYVFCNISSQLETSQSESLLLQKAQIGIGDLTINLDREKHVDFTKPFLTLGITILYRKPAPKSLNLFSFLKPLSVDVRRLLILYLLLQFFFN